jgi:hypothetical protein
MSFSDYREITIYIVLFRLSSARRRLFLMQVDKCAFLTTGEPFNGRQYNAIDSMRLADFVTS